jgi:hypothetical protein
MVRASSGHIGDINPTDADASREGSAKVRTESVDWKALIGKRPMTQGGRAREKGETAYGFELLLLTSYFVDAR